MSKHLCNRRSNVIVSDVPKLPSIDLMEYGEIAVNYASGYETLSIKNSDNQIIRFSSDNYFLKQNELLKNIYSLSYESDGIVTAKNIVSNELENLPSGHTFVKGYTLVSSVTTATYLKVNKAVLFDNGYTSHKAASSIQKLSFDDADATNMTSLDYYFSYMTALTTLDLSSFKTYNVLSMKETFENTSAMTSLNISSFDFSNVTEAEYMLINCASLTDLQFGKNLKVNIDMRWSPLTHASALSVIDGLATLSATNQGIVFSTTTYSTLTTAEIKVATDKGWTVASA